MVWEGIDSSQRLPSLNGYTWHIDNFDLTGAAMNVVMPDFDTLVTLHQQDPEALEIFRKHLLRDAVDTAPVEHRPALEKLLDRIEVARSSAKDPEEAAAIAFRMMQDSMSRLNDAWDKAMYEVADLQTTLLLDRMRH